ncbi:MAG TPA: ribulose-phosphate 3-epimerase [Candidatus Dependentiae bacterium]|nr:ribulose-phosphate 3-epimerase [Candidatus Dependentiae bacterium]HRQ63209.1 ribulose-phosphate 3-epimerase [Candidatus Dependentiae bacterium]
MPTIYPSLLGINPDTIEDTIKKLNPHCHGFHIDVMDHKFVPNEAFFDPEWVNAIDHASTHPSWVHLMIQQPQQFINSLNLTPGSMISFHYEVIGDSTSLINQIHGENWKASVAINPQTPIEKIFPVLGLVDQVLIMSVQPGFAGQDFIKSTIDKIIPLATYRRLNKFKFSIAMDGGIDEHNIAMLAQKGVEDFAVASAIFKTQDPIAALQKLATLIT